METANILVDLLEHYKRLYIRSLVARKTDEASVYLSVLAAMHYPTYLAAKSMKKPS
jgi:hypothetical protein